MNNTQPSQEQLAAWEEKYGEVLVLEIEGRKCFLRSIYDLKILKAAFTAMKKSEIAFQESLVNNAWLGGNEELRTDQELFESLAGEVTEMLDIPEFELVRHPDGLCEVIVEDYSCILRKPKREELRTAQERNTRKQPFETNIQLLRMIWVKGDEKLRTDIRLLLGVLPAVGNLYEKKVVSLKKNSSGSQ